jgi:hypothetical protein
VVLAGFGMCGPVVATVGLVGLTVTLASPSTESIITFRMLCSPGSGVRAPALFLAVGATAGALLTTNSWVRLQSLSANATVANGTIVHYGFSGETSLLWSFSRRILLLQREEKTDKKSQLHPYLTWKKSKKTQPKESKLLLVAL